MSEKHRRRSTDYPPFSEMVSRGNLDDRLETVNTRMVDHAAYDDERWVAHKYVHEVDNVTMRDYKREANEWRSTLSDLRLTFIPKAEFLSEHRALDAKLHGEIQALTGLVNTLDAKVDTITGDVKDLHTEQTARRSVFSDSRNVLATAGIIFGAIASVLLILDRLGK